MLPSFMNINSQSINEHPFFGPLYNLKFWLCVGGAGWPAGGAGAGGPRPPPRPRPPAQARPQHLLTPQQAAQGPGGLVCSRGRHARSQF
jgi:hypothetical protein